MSEFAETRGALRQLVERLESAYGSRDYSLFGNFEVNRKVTWEISLDERNNLTVKMLDNQTREQPVNTPRPRRVETKKEFQ